MIAILSTSAGSLRVTIDDDKQGVKFELENANGGGMSTAWLLPIEALQLAHFLKSMAI